MKPLDSQTETETVNWNFAMKEVAPKEDLVPANNVKNSQFKQPLIEFSGACAGCGEPAYIKIVTQLFGDRMMIANATGCSSIWGGSAPSTPYTKNSKGHGPSWANSLFEDNAEYGLGMYLGVKQMRNKLTDTMKALVNKEISAEAKAAFTEWLDTKEEGAVSRAVSEKVLEVLDKVGSEDPEVKALVAEIDDKKDYLVKRSVWMLGGDGWSYDIGYGGLDHVLATGEDVNVLVFDTEVYSNTGGQSSKATPTAAIAKFAASGKKSRKKDLGMMMMSYGNVYVAQVALGADKNQFMKAIMEAEAHHGPSIIICYSPCINHGLKEGMGRTIANQDQAVKCGYWHLYRFNPDVPEGTNPFTLDSKEPTESFRDFIMAQVRYSSLAKQFPEQAEELFELAEENAKARLESYRKLARQ